MSVKEFARSQRRLTLSTEAMNYFATWYKTRKYSKDAYSRSFESREDGHVLRTAACVALADRRGVISQDDIELGIIAISVAKNSGQRLFRDGVFDTRMIDGIDKVREILLQAGKDGIKNNVLFHKTRYVMKAVEYNALLDTMTEYGAVRKWIVSPSGTRGGRPSTYYVATTKLLQPDIWKKITSLVGSGAPVVELEGSHDEPTASWLQEEPQEKTSPRISEETAFQIDFQDHPSPVDK